MHIDVAELLRCPVVHQDTWLVARVDRMVGRHIVDGALGCPICGAEWAVEGGVADFRRGEPPPAVAVGLRASGADADERLVVRAAAQLGLDDGGRLVLLTGDAAGIATALGRVAPVHIVLVDPALPVEPADHLSVLLTDGDRLPLAASSLHGALLDRAARVSAATVADVLRPGGRLVAPAEAPVPPDVTVLARDGDEWVGERQRSASAPVPLRMAR